MASVEPEMARDLFRKQLWEDMWSRGLGPGDYFDALKPLPELTNQLESGALPVRGNALVPGCGRGYDVEALCRAGYTATGLDISETAAASAREYLESVSTPGEFRVVAGDFFTAPLGVFELVYDYTFFCAIPLEIRGDWGKRMADLVRKGGWLITVMFPVGKDIAAGGPPYGVSEKAYRDVLGDAFVPVDGPRQLDEASAHPRRGDGKTWWCRWERV